MRIPANTIYVLSPMVEVCLNLMSALSDNLCITSIHIEGHSQLRCLFVLMDGLVFIAVIDAKK